MALVLSKTGITTSNTVEAWHVTQSVDALTGIAAYDISISGSLKVTGSITTTQGISGSFTGSFGGNLNGTALLATTASYALTSSYVGNAISASFALTASFVNTAQTASYVLQAVSASFATSASTAVSASISDTASLAITASFVTTAQTASYVLQAVSSSFAISASRAVSASRADTASFATTASFVKVFPYTGSAVISGSFETYGSSQIDGVNVGLKNISSTQLGNAALSSLTTGDGNTGVGYQAGFNLQGGSNNTAIGDSSLFQASSANDNAAVGFYSLYNASSAQYNVGVGAYSLYNLTTGTGNVAIGNASGYNNTIGDYNVYIGASMRGVNGESNKLKIHSAGSTTTTPLILGDFSTRDLTIHGNLTLPGSRVLTLAPVHPLPTGVATGSFAVSASTPPRPYMWDGSSWYAL